MKSLFLGIMFSFVAFPAFSQSAPQSMMDQLLSVHVNIETNLARQLDQANAQIAKLSKEKDDLKKRIEMEKKTSESGAKKAAEVPKNKDASEFRKLTPEGVQPK